ncbi:MAG TPA: DUF359 domain-containing protein [Archaeoglobus profundus]|nr:DUF359 domain-containing protein [Archaeoglobus profundus]
MNMLKITKELRSILSKPHGILYKGKGINPIKKAVNTRKNCILVCVGDIVTYYALKAKIKPDIVVIDGKSLRKSLNGEIANEIIKNTAEYVTIKAVNPAGHITEDLVEKLFNAVKLAKSTKVKVFIEGEEDLAVMPLVILLPKGSLIIYGQPNEGVVALNVDEEKKILIFNLLEKMEKLNDDVLEKLRRWSNGYHCRER